MFHSESVDFELIYSFLPFYTQIYSRNDRPFLACASSLPDPPPVYLHETQSSTMLLHGSCFYCFFVTPQGNQCFFLAQGYFFLNSRGRKKVVQLKLSPHVFRIKRGIMLENGPSQPGFGVYRFASNKLSRVEEVQIAPSQK